MVSIVSFFKTGILWEKLSNYNNIDLIKTMQIKKRIIDFMMYHKL